MATNKVATVVLLDVGSAASEFCGSETFFKKCQWCLLRIIERKIFSSENDEVAIVLFGCEETDNNLAFSASEEEYSNICEFIPLQKPNWDMYEKVQKLNTTSEKNSNWLESLIVGLDYMKEQSKGKRFKDKQFVIFSNFTMKLDYGESKLTPIIDCINLDNIKVVVIGIDLEEESKDKELDSQLSGGIGLLFFLIDKVENGVSLSFTEAEEDIVYYEQKRKLGKFSKVNLCIGSKISIPIRWIKLNLEPTRIKWAQKPATTVPTGIKAPTSISVSSPTRKVVDSEISFVMETQKVTKFGDTEVILSYADLEAMKRETGPPSCVLLGCVKCHRINRKMLVGKDIYMVLPEKTARAQTMLSAFIDALIDANKFAIIRRIAAKNGKIKVGVMIPISDELGKAMFFLQLPFAEHAMYTPDGILPEPNNSEVLTVIDNIIDEMSIPDKPKDLLSKNPIFQLRSHILHLRQTGQLQKDSDNPPVPDFMKKLCDPYPELRENALPYIEKLKKLLPLNVDEVLLESDEIKQEEISLKGAENMFQEEERNMKVYLNKPSASGISETKDWENAETQEWPEELKEKYRNIEKIMDIDVPLLTLNEEKFTKYTKKEDEADIDNISLGKEAICKDGSNKISASQQMYMERQNTEIDFDTNDMLQNIRADLEKKK